MSRESGVVQFTGEAIATVGSARIHHRPSSRPASPSSRAPASSRRSRRRADERHAACAGRSRSTGQPLGHLRRNPRSRHRGKAARTQWLTELRAHDAVDVVAPLGRPFRCHRAVPCVLVGGGYGLGPALLAGRSAALSGVQHRDGARCASEDRSSGRRRDVGRRRRHGTTDDGSAGHRGWVSDVLPEVFRRTNARSHTPADPWACWKSVTRVAAEQGPWRRSRSRSRWRAAWASNDCVCPCAARTA